MAKKKVSSAHQKELYKRYATEMRWKKNKKRKLSAHLKNHENDTSANKALENLTGKTKPSGPVPPRDRGSRKSEQLNLYPEVLPVSIRDQIAWTKLN